MGYGSVFVHLAVLAGALLTLRRAAGRLAPHATFAPLAFLATRTPVIAAWCIGSASVFAVLWLPAAAEGREMFPLVLLAAAIPSPQNALNPAAKSTAA